MKILAYIIGYVLEFLLLLGVASIIAGIIQSLSTKKFQFRWPSLSMILLSVLIGGALTIAYTGNESFVTNPSCSDQTVSCTNLAQGYPRKFISGTSVVSSNDKTGKLEIFSEVSIGSKSLAFDLGFWSLISFTVMSTVYVWKTATPKSNKRKK